ncbi:unnamed protein product [Adineta steineri]|uniref:Uncharacterized protein n=1 Tax=Adineta steineri TaxID=433720 RepID=A0A814ESQ3_9BILA|nr:unnamed protein product [Adineta steineri]CAF0936106.1 unnamed protein product [Adineta steineri]CAF0971484.1 unnamed protein product [Adineta steineri]
MKQSHNDNFITTNQDYGSFYFGRVQHGQINRDEITSELAINDQVRNERRQLPSIAYNIMFNPQLSNGMLGLIANELFLLNPEISADELAENMIAITIPHEYLGMSVINPTKPYPGTETDCNKTPHLQRLLDHLETVKTTINDSKQQFNSESINSQQLEGIRYIYNPFTNSIPFRQI